MMMMVMIVNIMLMKMTKNHEIVNQKKCLFPSLFRCHGLGLMENTIGKDNSAFSCQGFIDKMMMKMMMMMMMTRMVMRRRRRRMAIMLMVVMTM